MIASYRLVSDGGPVATMSKLPPQWPATDAGIDSLRAFVIGLTMACPFEQANPPECPLHELRGQTLRQRLDWAAGLGRDELVDVMQRHYACLCRKEQEAGQRP
jgi:hypothetical protein